MINLKRAVMSDSLKAGWFLAFTSLSFLASTSAAQAAEPFIYRVGGSVTDRNFAGLAALAMNSIDQFVGLKLVVPAGNKATGVSTEESGGMLSVFHKDVDVNLAFSSGYRKTGDSYYIDGFYSVTYGGMHQGINGLGLAPARTMDVEASGKPVKDIEIDALKPDTKG